MLVVTAVFHLHSWVLRDAILSSSGLCGAELPFCLKKSILLQVSYQDKFWNLHKLDLDFFMSVEVWGEGRKRNKYKKKIIYLKLHECQILSNFLSK